MLAPHQRPGEHRTDVPFEIIEARALQVPERLRARIVVKVAEVVRLARRVYRRPFDMPKVSYAVRGSTAGKADFSQWEVMFNATLLQENEEAMVQEVVVHEVAHLVTSAMHGPAADPHGEEWKRVMRGLGAVPSTTHSFDVANAAVGRFVFKWRCTCREAVFSERKHKRLMVGRSAFKCRLCKQRLRYTGERRVDGVWELVGGAQRVRGFEQGRAGSDPGASSVVGGSGESNGSGLSPAFGGRVPPWFGPPSWERQVLSQKKPEPAEPGVVGFTDVPPFGGALPPWYRYGRE